MGALPGLAPWAALLLLGIGAMHWGAGRCAAALEAWRGPAGLRAVAAGALLGIATAAPWNSSWSPPKPGRCRRCPTCSSCCCSRR